MPAGSPLSFWIAFHALVVLLLAIDLLVLSRGGRRITFRVAALWTGVLILCALGFATAILLLQGRQPALEFLAGYTIEGSLSVDNLFVFVLLFRSFGLEGAAQRRALNWGVLGAILLRAGFIVGGIALLRRFHAVQYVFGALLLYAAYRLLRGEHDAKNSPAFLGWLGKWNLGSPMFLAIFAIEFTDLIFAVDSIPAVLAVTHTTFLAYTSNVFAILGLRSLFFLLSGLLDRLHRLQHGLGLVLVFVGAKMLAEPWVTISVGISLAVILGILALFTAASLLRPALPDSRAR